MTARVIRIDLDLCQGHGVCVDEAPTLFSYAPDESFAEATPRPLSAEDETLARRCASDCPTGAITIEEAS
jgi:ferredoxin